MLHQLERMQNGVGANIVSSLLQQSNKVGDNLSQQGENKLKCETIICQCSRVDHPYSHERNNVDREGKELVKWKNPSSKKT